jgi:hypothetical protein
VFAVVAIGAGHLSSVYRKLEISSRAQLPAALVGATV